MSGFVVPNPDNQDAFETVRARLLRRPSAPLQGHILKGAKKLSSRLTR